MDQCEQNYTQINAKAALEDKDSVFYYYQKLIRLRHENEIIVEGVFQRTAGRQR